MSSPDEMCRSSHRRCSIEKGVLKNFAKFTGKSLCRKIFLNKVAGSLQVFSCEFCEIFKNNYFVEHLQMAASKSEINPEKSLHWYGI